MHIFGQVFSALIVSFYMTASVNVSAEDIWNDKHFDEHEHHHGKDGHVDEHEHHHGNDGHKDEHEHHHGKDGKSDAHEHHHNK